jgi:2-oxoglutarate dehydrogenase E2 component (dihydrolipoamide succinyltransferase)
VEQDELIANIETDKVTIPVNCPEGGLLKEVFAQAGDTIEVGSNLFKLDPDAKPPAGPKKEDIKAAEVAAKAAKADAKPPGSGPISLFEPPRVEPKPEAVAKPSAPLAIPIGVERVETREKMSRMRLRIAERMKDAQNAAASLTTFNEVDMSALMDLRNRFKDDFAKKHGVKLGYMSAFVKAAARVLQDLPLVNARIDPERQEIVYSSFVDISVAVATPKGLVTPVLRSCERKSFAELEKEIAEYGQKARDGRIALEDLAGGTFTISNGGVFGSMMGTPILNAPQTAILGMHAIKHRPIVTADGKIEARPMMYLALTYDHRLVDGREAVTFLIRIKELLEQPDRFLLDL